MIVPTQNTASEYYQQAVSACHSHEWQAVCQLTQKAVAAAPDDMEIYLEANNLYAAALVMMQETEEALVVWRSILQRIPENIRTLHNIGYMLIGLKRYDEAIVFLEKILQITPHNAETHHSLGLAYADQGNIVQATLHYELALHYDPQFTLAKFSLATSLDRAGCIDEAYRYYQEILHTDPNHAETLSRIIFLQHYRYPSDPQDHMALLHRFAQQFVQEKSTSTSQDTILPWDTPLRVGFISADFYGHPVGLFLKDTLTLLQHESKQNQRLKLIAYYNNDLHDEYSQYLSEHFNMWHRVAGWNDASLIEQIRRDQIDILIDLSGHTGGNRLAVFAQKAAPLQLSWLGYFASTGLTAIDYVLADSICVPASEEHLFVEKVWRLPHLRYCFSAHEHAPDVSPAPCTHHPYIIFGCYQPLPKINDTVLQCWSRILAVCPQARLRLQIRNINNTAIRTRFILRLEAAGLDLQQVDLFDATNHSDYLASYAQVDILLDTFPFPGGTTTADALWMGVPTITLAQPSMLGRQGEALMISAGLPDWVVQNEYAYVQKAVQWGQANQNQRRELAALRASLREQVQPSPVFNAENFAQEFNQTLYTIWRLHTLAASPTTIRVVCATRENEIDFHHKTALGQSLARLGLPVELRLFATNKAGLPHIYNQALAEAQYHPAALVFVHDDVWLLDDYWPAQILAGLRHFDIIGIAGNRRRVANQPSWGMTNTTFTMDSQNNLSGTVAHANDTLPYRLGVFGPSCQIVKLLDGVLLAAHSQTLQDNDVRFDENLDFHFYDLDFCREAEIKQLHMGTWPINIIHESAGNPHSESWRTNYEKYLNKWGS